jgi:hypothetical protein
MQTAAGQVGIAKARKIVIAAKIINKVLADEQTSGKERLREVGESTFPKVLEGEEVSSVWTSPPNKLRSSAMQTSRSTISPASAFFIIDTCPTWESPSNVRLALNGTRGFWTGLNKSRDLQ